MDHIAIPCDNVAHEILEVPYLENRHLSDHDCGMQQYPLCCSVDTERLAKNKEPRLRLPEAAQFIQTWLWFGTLSECLRDEIQNANARNRMDHHDFIRQNKRGKVVTLASLQKVLEKKSASVSSRLNQGNRQLMRCIKIANSFVWQAVLTLYPPDFEVDNEQLRTPIFLVLLSVQILGQTLLRSTTGSIGYLSNGDVAIYNNCTRLVDLLLSQSGWCRKDIERLPQDIIFRYYLSYFRRTTCLHHQTWWTHGRETCDKHRVMQDTNFTPHHTHQACSCPLIAVCKTMVDFNGSIQLYTYEEQILKCQNVYEGKRSPQQNSELPFVAISHVRAFGLGNDDENSLPHCQLVLLQSLVNQILQPDQQSCNTPFWLDALGLPLDRKLRKEAIHSLPSVFSQASAVLVLDPTLYTHAFSINKLDEAIIRIRYSLWKSRLWTLEEGFYAQRLMFRFSNSLVSLDDILQEMRPSLIMPASLIEARTTFDIPGAEVLKEVLSRLAADIHMGDKHTLPIQRHYLHSVLRAGYLLSPRFSHMIEENEVKLQNKVMPDIFNTYSPGVNLSHTIASVVERLYKICSRTEETELSLNIT